MKQLFLLSALLAVLGIAGFFYRSAIEAPERGTNTTNTACTAEARICPDGTAVGRGGPSCEFAACSLPNVEIPGANLSFVLPTGFITDENAYGADTSLLGAFVKSSLIGSSTVPDSIIIRRYTIPEGKDANAVMLANSEYETSGQKPTSMNEFKPVIIDGKTFQMIGTERFEGVVKVSYFLARDTDVIRFEAIQHDVLTWTDPSLNIRTLSTVAALERMLSSL